MIISENKKSTAEQDDQKKGVEKLHHVLSYFWKQLVRNEKGLHCTYMFQYEAQSQIEGSIYLFCVQTNSIPPKI